MVRSDDGGTGLRGCVALITGASRGIGRAIAAAFAREGMDLALTARTTDGLEETAAVCREAGARVLVAPADLADEAALPPLVERVAAHFGRLDVLVNNAGVYGRGAAHDADLAAWDHALAVNLRAPMVLTRAALPHIVRSSRPAVINIASIAGKMSFANGGAYTATKHGLVGFSGSVFEDVRALGVKVTAICPGYVATDLVAGRDLDPARMIQPEDIARTALFVLTFPDTGCPTEIVVRPQRSPYRRA